MRVELSGPENPALGRSSSILKHSVWNQVFFLINTQ